MALYPEAIRDYTNALYIDNANTHSLYNRAICYERIRKY